MSAAPGVYPIWVEESGPVRVTLFAARRLARDWSQWGWWQVEYHEDLLLPEELEPVFLQHLGTEWEDIERWASLVTARRLERAAKLAELEATRIGLAIGDAYPVGRIRRERRRFRNDEELAVFAVGHEAPHLPLPPRVLMAQCRPFDVQCRWRSDRVQALWHPYSGIGVVALFGKRSDDPSPVHVLLANWRGRPWAEAQRELHALTDAWNQFVVGQVVAVSVRRPVRSADLAGEFDVDLLGCDFGSGGNR